jgi:DNA invertase Pin-like site-specific DNA recombinase
MIGSESKIRSDHRTRKACIYVRQSSLVQVQQHTESTRRQYELCVRAGELGWAEEQIEVIDEDLGQSASNAGKIRAGFQRLLAGVVTGQVGGIFSVEVSRLARQDSEGYRLVEVAALTGTLLIDECEVYDPLLADDRLLLGLKVLLSSNEVRMMNQRLRENKLRKAQHGDLRLSLPVGLINDPRQGVRIDPDEQVQGAVRLIFERFRLGGGLSNVVRYFQENGLLFPRHQGNWEGPLEWGALSLPRAHNVLSNPLYAGAYVYGRGIRRLVSQKDGRLQQKRCALAPEEWGAVQWDAFPGYISREEYDRNQRVLEQNRNRPCIAQRGRRRDGPALLTGVVLCGRCGKRMHVGYGGEHGQHITYLCNTDQMRYAKPACQRVPGAGIDQLVTECVLAALTPAQIELSLAVLDELERQQSELVRQRQRRLEGAQYAAHLAQRRYEQVDPDNRLVARTLEAEWEACLREVKRQEQDFEHFCQQAPLRLLTEQRQHLLKLAEDLPKIWNAPSTSWTERKNLLKLLIADVTITRQEQNISIQIRWHTNLVDIYQLPLPIVGSPPTPEAIVQRLQDLCPIHTDQQIAEILNQEGLRTTYGNPFTTNIVRDTRLRNGISKTTKQPK